MLDLVRHFRQLLRVGTPPRVLQQWLEARHLDQVLKHAVALVASAAERERLMVVEQINPLQISVPLIPGIPKQSSIISKTLILQNVSKQGGHLF